MLADVVGYQTSPKFAKCGLNLLRCQLFGVDYRNSRHSLDTRLDTRLQMTLHGLNRRADPVWGNTYRSGEALVGDHTVKCLRRYPERASNFGSANEPLNPSV